MAKRQAGSDTDLQNAAADAFGGRDRGAAALAENRGEDDIVYRCPSAVGGSDAIPVQIIHDGQTWLQFLTAACSDPTRVDSQGCDGSGPGHSFCLLQSRESGLHAAKRLSYRAEMTTGFRMDKEFMMK